MCSCCEVIQSAHCVPRTILRSVLVYVSVWVTDAGLGSVCVTDVGLGSVWVTEKVKER